MVYCNKQFIRGVQNTTMFRQAAKTSKHMSGKYQPHTQALELLQRRSSATAAQEGSEKVGSMRVVDAHVSYATISVFTKLCRCQNE